MSDISNYNGAVKTLKFFIKDFDYYLKLNFDEPHYHVFISDEFSLQIKYRSKTLEKLWNIYLKSAVKNAEHLSAYNHNLTKDIRDDYYKLQIKAEAYIAKCPTKNNTR